MHLDLTDDEAAALAQELYAIVENDRARDPGKRLWPDDRLRTVEALVRAKERGVDVRLIADKTTPCEHASGARTGAGGCASTPSIRVSDAALTAR
jgi:hypothetical protein